MDYVLVRKNEKFQYSAIIIQTACEPPTLLLNKISDDLKKSNIYGDILIDSLLYTGNSNERFIRAFFDNEQFVRDSFYNIKINRDSIERKITSDYLRMDESILESSCLTSIQKKLILKGLDL